MSVIRFGVSLEKELLELLDNFVEENLFSNRSQAIRHLISSSLAEKKWHCSNEVTGSVTILYDRQKRGVMEQLAGIRHSHDPLILSMQQHMIDHNQCLELVAVRGRAADLTDLADRLRSVRGVRFARLTMTRITPEEEHA
ncbi:MAG: nickel-responsive transcriptional regulator NikR [Bacteroidales bacterium]|nr:nickel-responsive transcriptional regulator NikR [Bacteroidales bacterium]MCB9029084.1 nickel-responsive transcriptional regulator NikR [Bacteroidales bacterium]HOO66336.1 nickel-responsive transcriptional regulator NikR [Bacteroidales bacterium]HPE22398.1 nickel-responsive transcriptional regulator NikR [Bacteroidales bacterium]HPJ05241.1 nickel-responsive transcriptional regulator NikR [Bacteroidales bacterium]